MTILQIIRATNRNNILKRAPTVSVQFSVYMFSIELTCRVWVKKSRVLIATTQVLLADNNRYIYYNAQCGLSAPSGNIVHYNKPRTYTVSIYVLNAVIQTKRERGHYYIAAPCSYRMCSVRKYERAAYVIYIYMHAITCI